MEKAQNFKTDSLLALEACRPLTVQAHDGDWARIVTPPRLREWERVLSGHPDREFAQFVGGSVMDSGLDLTIVGPSVNLDQAI